MLSERARADRKLEDQLDEATRLLQESMTIKYPDQDRIMYVVVRSDDAPFAAKIANLHVDTFVQYSRGLLSTDTRQASDALSAEFAASRRQEVLAVATSENQRALELAEVRYDIGSGNLLGVQQQQLAVHGSRSTLIRMTTERLVQRVNLYLALGGGFDAAPKVAASSGP
jgi:hypothetical protein